jgi:hypothetical protein
MKQKYEVGRKGMKALRAMKGRNAGASHAVIATARNEPVAIQKIHFITFLTGLLRFARNDGASAHTSYFIPHNS